jgi:hypothetical protein
MIRGTVRPVLTARKKQAAPQSGLPEICRA